MRDWYLLVNRRHEGPFEKYELVEKAQKGLLKPDDYIIAGEDLAKNHLAYKTAKTFLGAESFVQQAALDKEQEFPRPRASVPSKSPTVSDVIKTSWQKEASVQEGVSWWDERLSNLSFAKIVQYVGVAVVCVLAFNWWNSPSEKSDADREVAGSADRNRPGSSQKRRRDANAARSARRQQQARQPQQQQGPHGGSKKLMPTERPEVYQQGPSPASQSAVEAQENFPPDLDAQNQLPNPVEGSFDQQNAPQQGSYDGAAALENLPAGDYPAETNPDFDSGAVEQGGGYDTNP